jgi:mycothiol synthase
MSAPADLREMAGREDMHGWAELHNRIFPGHPTNAEDELVFRSLDPQRLDLVALVGGQPVGLATAGRIFQLTGSTNSHSRLGVLPEHRGRGIGSLLLDAISRRAEQSGLRGHQMHTSEDEVQAIAYLERRGFRIVQRALRVGLELAGAEAEAAREPPAGLRITTLAAEPELERQVYEVAVEATADMPILGDPQPGTYEQWHEIEVAPVSKPADAFFVAVEGDRVLGYAALWFAQGVPDAAWHAMTAVARSARGRGVAMALKRAQIAWAIRRGLAWLHTENDEKNAPMRHINARLGYRPQPAELMLHGPLVLLDPPAREP